MRTNFVSETISSGGTGNITLSGAVDSAHITFFTAFGMNVFFFYVAEDGDDREVGIGHLTTSTGLVRDTILETLVSGTLDNTSPSALNLSTSTIVSVNSSAQSFMPSFSPYYVSTGGGTVGQGANPFSTNPNLSVSLSADVAILTPCFLPPMLITSVSVYCTVAAASSGLHIGAYRRSSNGEPGNLFANFTFGGAIDTSTTGAKTATLGTPTWFPGGDFWMCCLTDDSSVDLRGYSATLSGHHSFGLDSAGNTSVTFTKGTTFGTLPTNFASFARSGSLLQTAYYVQ